MGYNYIMFKSGMWRFPVIYPDKLVHEDIANALIDAEVFPKKKGEKVEIESAGAIDGLDVDAASGRSGSLHLNSHDDDAKIINTLPYLHGIGFKDD